MLPNNKYEPLQKPPEPPKLPQSEGGKPEKKTKDAAVQYEASQDIIIEFLDDLIAGATKAKEKIEQNGARAKDAAIGEKASVKEKFIRLRSKLAVIFPAFEAIVMDSKVADEPGNRDFFKSCELRDVRRKRV
jgi:hypothetical protein